MLTFRQKVEKNSRFQKNNLHLVGYSRPINKIIKKNKLEAYSYY